MRRDAAVFRLPVAPAEQGGILVGAAPETMQRAELTEEQTRDAERQWFLDADSGELKPEEDSDRDRRDRPSRIRVPRWTFD
jgi:hypothetical protein